MVDMYSTDKRSEIMGRIVSSNTHPEIRVRAVLHRLGYKFRLHQQTLPRKLDVVG